MLLCRCENTLRNKKTTEGDTFLCEYKMYFYRAVWLLSLKDWEVWRGVAGVLGRGWHVMCILAGLESLIAKVVP